jgi:hypothetical protein
MVVSVWLYKWDRGLELGAATSVSRRLAFREGWPGLPSQRCYVIRRPEFRHGEVVGGSACRLGLPPLLWDEVVGRSRSEQLCLEVVQVIGLVVVGQFGCWNPRERGWA